MLRKISTNIYFLLLLTLDWIVSISLLHHPVVTFLIAPPQDQCFLSGGTTVTSHGSLAGWLWQKATRPERGVMEEEEERTGPSTDGHGGMASGRSSTTVLSFPAGLRPLTVTGPGSQEDRDDPIFFRLILKLFDRHPPSPAVWVQMVYYRNVKWGDASLREWNSDVMKSFTSNHNSNCSHICQ